MDKHTEKVNDIEICTVPKGVLQYTHGVMEMSEYDKNLFHKVYREISEQLGIETALTIHQMFKGTQVNFPVRFFDTQCVKEMIIKEYDGTNVKTLAKKIWLFRKISQTNNQRKYEKEIKEVFLNG